MTPERLRFIIESSQQRSGTTLMEYRQIAAFLDVKPITLRRWLNGERKVPRCVELLFEIHYRWPNINARTIQAVIDDRDRQDAAQ